MKILQVQDSKYFESPKLQGAVAHDGAAGTFLRGPDH